MLAKLLFIYFNIKKYKILCKNSCRHEQSVESKWKKEIENRQQQRWKLKIFKSVFILCFAFSIDVKITNLFNVAFY
jgi:hypothetical protein